jgi:hypothetical protein
LTLKMIGDREPAADTDTFELESVWSSSTLLLC